MGGPIKYQILDLLSGFPRRLENLENENGHGKVMEHAKLAKSHRMLSSVIEFYILSSSYLSTKGFYGDVDFEGISQ